VITLLISSFSPVFFFILFDIGKFGKRFKKRKFTRVLQLKNKLFQNFPNFFVEKRRHFARKKGNAAFQNHDNAWVKKLQGVNPTKGQSRYNPPFLRYRVK
jgi:hypothetical protein